MSNQLSNAGGLEGTTRWTASAGTLSVDEDVRGGPGRAVFKSTSTGAAAGQTDVIAPTSAGRVTVVAGQYVEAFAGVWSAASGASCRVIFRDGAGVQVGLAQAVSLVRPAEQAATRGVPKTFDFRRGRFEVPVGAVRAELQAFVTVPVGGAELCLLKPFLDVVAVTDKPRRWDPGVHTNTDLQLPVWPAGLPGFLLDGYAAAPTPLRTGFGTDAQIPLTRQIGSTPHHRIRPSMILDQVQRDVLQAFFEDGGEPFWIVRPGTDQLCRAWWLDDGDPADAEQISPTTVRTEIGLLLEVV